MSDTIKAMMRQVGEDIANVGWHATGVIGDGGCFMYTTGLTSGDHPELVIAGLPPGIAHGMLASAVEVIRSGIALAPGRDYEGIAAGFPVRFREVDQELCLTPMSVTNRHYGHRVPAVQLLWPDPKGIFPGEPGCDAAMASAQDIYS